MLSDEWTKVPYESVWDTGGMFDPRHGAFVAPRNMLCVVHGRRARSHPVRGGDSPLRLCALQERHFGGRGEGWRGRPPQDRLRSGPTARGRNFTPNLVATRTGDVYEIYVRHDIGAEVYLSSKDIDLPDDPQFAAPTANYFMGMYEAH